MNATKKLGSGLQVGDTIEVWFGRDRIVKLEPYNGPLKHLWKEGAQIATLALHRCGMTIDNSAYYDTL